MEIIAPNRQWPEQEKRRVRFLPARRLWMAGKPAIFQNVT
jgi:hypothetical protein